MTEYYKRVPFQKIHKNRIYKMQELADLLGVTNATVWNWVQCGFPILNPDDKPWFIDGGDAKQFLKVRFENQKMQLGIFDFPCFKCKKGVKVVPESLECHFNGWIDVANQILSIRMSGICPECGKKINRFETSVRIKSWLEHYSRLDLDIKMLTPSI